MAQKLLKRIPGKVAPKKAQVEETGRVACPHAAVLVGTYKEKQLSWIKRHGIYNYPVKDGDEFDEKSFASIKELWLYADVKGTRHVFAAEFVGIKTRDDLVNEYGYPANGVFNAETQRRRGGRAGAPRTPHASCYYVFKAKYLDYGTRIDDPFVIARTADFGGRSAKVKKAIEQFKADGEFAPLEHYLPSDLAKVPRNRLRVCEAAVQMSFWDLPQMKLVLRQECDERIIQHEQNVCAPIAAYSREAAAQLRNAATNENNAPIRVVELFAGVGGFRIGLERASNRFETVWNNQWEPATKRQDASIVYQSCFGIAGHSNNDISTVPVAQIPQADLLVGGFPCQDYSVATTLKNSGGIEGKKGVLWWQIHRILRDSKNPPPYLFLENVDRLLKSPASQRGRDFAIILASLSDLGYAVEWRVINAADYGMPQRRRRTYIVAYRKGTPLANDATACKDNASDWIFHSSIIGKAFAARPKDGSSLLEFNIQGKLPEVTQKFNKGVAKTCPFKDAGLMVARHVWTQEVSPIYKGKRLTLGQLIVDERDVPEEFFIDEKALEEWKYLKGPKSEMRKTPEGFEYHYSEGGMAFPDSLDKPSRTIITGEGGSSPSRFKHVILTPSGRYRRLIPVELERLNMFPDNHTQNASDGKRAFLMGNALVTGIVERIGLVLKERM